MQKYSGFLRGSLLQNSIGRFTRRSISSLTGLPHISREKGIPGLYTPQGVEQAHFKYQELLLAQLNKELAALKDTYDMSALSSSGEGQDDRLLVNIMTAAAHDASLYKATTLASQLYNDLFFFAGLRSESVNPSATIGPKRGADLAVVDISTDVKNSPALDENLSWLEYLINTSFGSILSFRELLINRADAIFGNGYVWVVMNRHTHNLQVVNTYNWANTFAQSATDIVSLTANTDIYVPVLNVSVWQHSFVPDYGFDKRTFLENVFDCIDWSVVSKRIPKNAISSDKFVDARSTL